jgi:hypothetical protein
MVSIGRSGGGPGKFRDISSLSPWPGDSLLAWDIQQRRLTPFDHEGMLGRSFTLATTTEVPFGNGRGSFADGSVLAIGSGVGGAPRPDRTRAEVPVYRFTRDGSPDTTYPFLIVSEAFIDQFDNLPADALRAARPLARGRARRAAPRPRS